MQKGYPYGYPLHEKSARRDSNPRPRPWQGRAPPTEPLAHILLSLAVRLKTSDMIPRSALKVKHFFQFLFFIFLHLIFYTSIYLYLLTGFVAFHPIFLIRIPLHFPVPSSIEAILPFFSKEHIFFFFLHMMYKVWYEGETVACVQRQKL